LKDDLGRCFMRVFFINTDLEAFRTCTGMPTHLITPFDLGYLDNSPQNPWKNEGLSPQNMGYNP